MKKTVSEILYWLFVIFKSFCRPWIFAFPIFVLLKLAILCAAIGEEAEAVPIEERY